MEGVGQDFILLAGFQPAFPAGIRLRRQVPDRRGTRGARQRPGRYHGPKTSLIYTLQLIVRKDGNTLAVGQNRGFGELPELPAIDECFQDVLLDFVVAVNYG